MSTTNPITAVTTSNGTIININAISSCEKMPPLDVTDDTYYKLRMINSDTFFISETEAEKVRAYFGR